MAGFGYIIMWEIFSKNKDNKMEYPPLVAESSECPFKTG